MKLRELRDKRGQLVDKARGLLDKAEAENRDLTAAEKTEWDKIIAEQEQIRDQIDREERQVELDREMAGKEFRRQSGGGQPHPTAKEYWTNYRTGQRLPVLGRDDRLAGTASDVSLGGVLRALVMGPSTEAERRALAEGVSPSGGYAIPQTMAATITDALRAEAVVLRAGARTVPIDTPEVSYCRLTSDPVASWHLENAEITEGPPSFGATLMRSRTLACLVRISRELLSDAPNIEESLSNAFIGAFSAAVDKAILSGSGTLAEPVGLLNDTSIPSMSLGTDGGLLGWDALYDALETLWTANAKDPSALILHPRSLASLERFKDGEGHYLEVPKRFESLAFLRTSQLPIDMTHGARNDCSAAILGDFTDLTIGIRQDLTIDILRERFAELFQFGFVVHARMDYVVGHEASFVNIKGILP